jgi:hypothetical protein
MTFAFLFLTNDKFTHPEVVWNFVKTQNVYIHPKHPEQVQPKFRPFIIDSLVETNWGEPSIVDATINLLEESYSTEENLWFVLLSQDAYPLHSFDIFEKKFEKSVNGKCSMFNLINTIGTLTKTSQWWILHRNDVRLILENNKKYRKIFTINKKSDGAFDEFYFLSLLKWLNPRHDFVDKKVMYDEFQKGTIQRNPKIYNKLIKCDENKINGSFFIRKVTPNFSLKLCETKKELKVVYIGTETDQQNIISAISNDDFDLFILSSVNIELIHPDILSKTICVIQIIYKFLLETILSLSYEKCLESWDSILFTTEKYDLSKSYNIDGLSLNNLPLKNTTFFTNIKQFKVVKDTNGNIAYYKKNENYNRVKKTRIPRNKYIPNLPTFKDWESPPYDDSISPPYTPHNEVPSPPYIPPSPVNTSPYNEVPSPPYIPPSPVNTSPYNEVPSPPYIPPSPVNTSPYNEVPSPPYIPPSPVNTSPYNEVPSHIYTSSNNEPFIVPKCVRKTITPPPSPKSVIIRIKKKHFNVVLNTPQPSGMTLKIGKKCPKGTKTHKINDKFYCKTVVDKKDKVLSTHIAESIKTNDDVNGMTLKVGKKCPKGSKTHKINDKLYCKTTVDKKDKVLSIKTDNDVNGMTLKVGKKCPKGSKTHKINDKLYCKTVV